MTPEERARLLALVEQWRSGKSQDRWQSAYQNGKTEAFWECADELAALLPPVGPEVGKIHTCKVCGAECSC